MSDAAAALASANEEIIHEVKAWWDTHGDRRARASYAFGSGVDETLRIAFDVLQRHEQAQKPAPDQPEQAEPENSVAPLAGEAEGAGKAADAPEEIPLTVPVSIERRFTKLLREIGWGTARVTGGLGVCLGAKHHKPDLIGWVRCDKPPNHSGDHFSRHHQVTWPSSDGVRLDELAAHVVAALLSPETTLEDAEPHMQTGTSS